VRAADNHNRRQSPQFFNGLLVVSQMQIARPRWLAIRNVSDPQIKAEGSLKQQAQVAAQIYKGFGRWSSVCSAIACWATIAAE
jgi:hypothetical protein